MFETLSERLISAISSIKGKSLISEKDLDNTLREIRVALLEADVSLIVVKKFISEVKADILGKEILKNIHPDQMIIKLVHDKLIEILGQSNTKINLDKKPPATVLFFGLQGSGKTTTVAKLAKIIKNDSNKKILLISTDIYRPAAQKQLELLSQEIGVYFHNIDTSKTIEENIHNTLSIAKKEFYDVILIDTAGRQVIDKQLMDEIILISKLTDPVEKIIVVDSLIGQDAANIANTFNEQVGITGIVLTRIDGDSRGGAALSVKSITGAPIKYLGTGEKIDDIENFYPDRIANRILGMGDIVSLVEKAQENIENDELENIEKKISSGTFDLSDFSKQLSQMNKMGGIKGMLSLLPGISKAQKSLAENNIDNNLIKKQIAMINSMTKKERSDPHLIKASRKIRISNGSGTKVQEVNKLLKQFFNTQKIMKKMKNFKSGKLPQNLLSNFKGNFPSN
ncbi:MAG: signal recognition particle protein [Pelagibacteraceae bacterium]|nr:signal recognition particle protein [Pelagibacteraceae bacterium]